MGEDASTRSGERLLASMIDWGGTAFGARAGWPQNLRALVDLVEASPVPMLLLWGPDHLVVYNDAYHPIAGDAHPHALGRPLREAWPEQWAEAGSVLAAVLAGEPQVIRNRHGTVFRRGVAEDVWLDRFYAPVRDDAGAVAGALCTVIDVTEQVAAGQREAESERRLADSETRLGILVNQASIGIAQSDLAGRLVSVNDRFCAIIGRPAATVIGQTIDTFVHPNDRALGQQTLDDLLASGKAAAVEERIVRPDGSVVWVNEYVSLARNEWGEPDFLIRLCHDITSRKEAEALARQSTERIQLALGAGAILGTWVWDAASRNVSGDARFAGLFGLDLEAARSGVPVPQALASVHPDDAKAVIDAFDTAVREGGFYRAECRVRQTDGVWRWLEANGHCEVDAAGVVRRIPGILVNVDQRRAVAIRSAFLVELGDQLRTIEHPDAVMASTAKATGRYLNAAQVGYGEISPDGRLINLLGGWSRNAAPMIGRFEAAVFGSEAAARLQAGEASIAPRQIPDADVSGSGGPLGAVLAVPLFREGRWHAMMFASDPGRRTWEQADADVLREVVGRTWEGMERARAVVTLRKAQSRQAFLLRLNDHLSELHDSREVVETVAESLGVFLKATRAGYGETSLDTKTIVFDGGWTDGSVPAARGTPLPYEGLLDAEVAELSRGLTVSEADYQARPGLDPKLKGLLDASGTRSVLAVPLIREGRFRAGLWLTQSQARHWSLEEVSLVQEVARRTWDALERTRAEQALQRSEARLRAMFDTLPVGIVFAEMPSGQVTEGNARVEQILGYSVLPSSDGTPYGEWVAFDEDGRRVAIDEHPLYIAVTTGEVARRVFHHQRGDGQRVWISVIGAPVRDAEGRITGGLVTIVDIDREKRAGEALRELNATLEQQVEQRTRERDRVWRNSPDLLAVMGTDGVLRDVNPSWTALLGWSATELVGQEFGAFVHPADVVKTFAALDDLRSRPLSAPFENRYRTVSGDYRWFSWTASLEDDAVYSNGRDVTAEREQAEALRLAEEQLRQSQKMEAVGQLTGGIAHDFNNLLTGITGALDLLSKRIAQGRLENTARYIDMAMNSANRAASLTHRLLAFSRRQPLEAKPVDANRLVRSMDDLLRRTLGERITLDIVVGEALWLTLCDPHQLENALLNLVINARDAMPDGGRLTIETANAVLGGADAARDAGTKPGRYVTLAVSDTGTGMTADVIARAFDPFFTTKPIGQGTGLGLSMIYGFARQSDGTVKISSEVGRGTTVWLYLPRVSGELPVTGEDHGEAPRSTDGETVLIVEDDETVRDLVLEVLRDLGYRALEAHDGSGGLRVVESAEKIDLLVTDVGLPGLNGRQLADRAREVRPDLKVLFITGYAENATFGGGVLDPGMQMIPKPFAVEAFATKIKEMIEAKR